MERMADAPIIVRAGPERIDDLRPLWEALQERHILLVEADALVLIAHPTRPIASRRTWRRPVSSS